MYFKNSSIKAQWLSLIALARTGSTKFLMWLLVALRGRSMWRVQQILQGFNFTPVTSHQIISLPYLLQMLFLSLPSSMMPHNRFQKKWRANSTLLIWGSWCMLYRRTNGRRLWKTFTICWVSVFPGFLSFTPLTIPTGPGGHLFLFEYDISWFSGEEANSNAVTPWLSQLNRVFLKHAQTTGYVIK